MRIGSWRMKQIITTVSVVALLPVTSGALAQDPGSLGKPNIVLVFMDNKLSTGTLRRGAALTTGPSRTHNFIREMRELWTIT